MYYIFLGVAFIKISNTSSDLQGHSRSLLTVLFGRFSIKLLISLYYKVFDKLTFVYEILIT